MLPTSILIVSQTERGGRKKGEVMGGQERRGKKGKEKSERTP